MQDASMVLLYVADPVASAAFYEEVLGTTPLEASPGFAMFRMAEGMRLGLWLASEIDPPATRPGGSELAFMVADVDAAHAGWVAAGRPVEQVPTDMDFGRTFTGLDPDGHRLRFFRPAGM